MRITRPFVLLALAALTAPRIEASRASVWESNPPSSMTAAKSDAAGLLAALASAATADAEPTEPPLFNLRDVVLVDTANADAEHFDLGPLTLVDPNLLRGPPPSYPETRVRGFELLPPFRVGASPRLSLWSRQACGFSCGEVASDSRYDPWGLKVTVKAEIPGAPVNPLPSVDLETGRHPFLDEALLGPLSSVENAGRKVLNTLANGLWAIGRGLDRLDEKAWENGIACRGCTSFGIDMATLLSGTREAQTTFQMLDDYGRAFGARPPPSASTPPVAGETESTRIGREAHGGFAEADRSSGLFSDVSSPITDRAGNPIQVPRRVDLKTGKPQPGSPLQEAIPDAVSYDRFELILDYKPMGRPIAKDRQEIIRFIKAYEAREGRLPKRIAVPRYDPRTGELVKTDLYAPGDFLPKTGP